MSCDHEFEILDVIQVVGWAEDDTAIPCMLEINQCKKCGIRDESMSEGYLELDNEIEYDMMYS